MQQRNGVGQAEALSAAIRKMFETQKELQGAFPKRLFTPDGRMMGDIGEAIGEIEYQVIVDPKSRKHWDGKREDGCEGCRELQIRATQKDETYVKEPPDGGYLLVFKIFRDGTWECCYNGSAMRVWGFLAPRNADHTNAKAIKIDELRRLNRDVEGVERIAKRLRVVEQGSAPLNYGGDDAAAVSGANFQVATKQNHHPEP
jgi:hypothetical protein